VPPSAILLVGGLVFLAYAYPGLMTLDSVDQLTEARAGFYTDAHPPAMAVLWGVLDRIISGGFPILPVQGGTVPAGRVHLPKRPHPAPAPRPPITSIGCATPPSATGSTSSPTASA